MSRGCSVTANHLLNSLVGSDPPTNRLVLLVTVKLVACLYALVYYCCG